MFVLNWAHFRFVNCVFFLCIVVSTLYSYSFWRPYLHQEISDSTAFIERWC